MTDKTFTTRRDAYTYVYNAGVSDWDWGEIASADGFADWLWENCDAAPDSEPEFNAALRSYLLSVGENPAAWGV